MTETPYACVLVVVVLVLHQGVTAWKPKMNPEVDELLIQEGTELRIECQGEGRIQFSTQQLATHVVPSNFTVSFDEATGTYTFIRPITTGQDTGWYACAEEGIQIRNDEQTIEHPSEVINWIYIYVNSTIPFADMGAYYEYTVMMAGSDGVVPCRPTSPKLPVKLEINNGEAPVSEDTDYDPKIGFILKEVGKERNGEMYKCKLGGTYLEDAHSWPSYYAVVEDVTVMDNPTIIQDTLHHVVWGQDLTLECRISDERHKFSLNWTVPSSIPKHRIHYPEKMSYIGQIREKETWKVEVTIKDIQETDGGEYTCTVMGVNGIRSESSTTVKIWDPSYTYINMTVEGNKDILLREDDTVQWKVIIDTYPKILTVDWYTEGGNMIVTNEGKPETSRYSHTHNGIIHVFKISKLTIEDSGQYTVRVTTSKNVGSIVLPLTVVGQPVIHMDNILTYYPPGMAFVFISRIFASPPPNVTWRYIEYPDFPSKDNSAIIPLSNLHEVWVEKPPFNFASSVNVTVNMTGDIICKSCNDVGCTENIQQIFVSDVPGLFAIRDPGMITEGDDISLTCGASVYQYTDFVMWKYKDFRDEEFNSERMNVTKRKTKFTWQSILYIRNVSQSDSGEYTCESVNNERHPERETYQLRVQVASAPEFTYTNMNNSEISIHLKKDKNKTVLLECRADGRPIPKITWHKDNELIEESNQYKFSENNTRLQITYFSDADTDSGRYGCKAVNRLGTAERYMDIKIAGKSDNTTLWISLSCVVIAIIIAAIAYKILKVNWKK